MNTKTALHSLVSRFGICVAALYYLLLAAIIFFVCVRHNSPENIVRNLMYYLHTRFFLWAVVPVPVVLYLLGGVFGKLIHLEPALKNRKDRLGIYFAGAYLFLVVTVFVFIESTAKPDNVGYDWLPFVILAMPWYSLSVRLLLSGLLINAGILYLLGMLLDKLRRGIAQNKARRSIGFKLS